MSEIYRSKLLANGYEKFINSPYSFSYFQNNKPVTNEMRRRYYSYLSQDGSIKDSSFSNKVYNQLLLYKLRDRLKKIPPLTWIFNVVKSLIAFFKTRLINK